jgi:hypothetical protein
MDDDKGANSGSAYIYFRDGSSWIAQAKLTAGDGAADEHFGGSVSISGDYVIVGADMDDDKGSNSGSAYIYFRDGSSWTEQAKLVASDGADNDYFGYTVSISGDYAIVGAPYDDINGVNSGSAYIFYRSGTSWTEQVKLMASDGAAWDEFGWSVGISGDYAIVGAYYDDDKGTDSGSAYIFSRSGTSWSEQAKLTAGDGVASDVFGISVGISGDYAIVGACGVDGMKGSAYIFNRNDTIWTEQAKLIASDNTAGDCFGFSTSISGDYAIAGARFDDDKGTDSGSAYLFVRIDTIWSEQVKFTAFDGAAYNDFGYSVNISGNCAVVGSYADNNLTGSVYLFEY